MEIYQQDRNFIGLFGTCGKSIWRQAFVDQYTVRGIPFFNPQVADGMWTPADSDKEICHLANDDIVIFAITDETYAFISLMEAAMAIGRMKDSFRKLIVFIDPDVSKSLIEADLGLAKASILAREMLIKHLLGTTHNSVFLVKDLQAALDVSLTIWKYKLECDALMQEVV